LTISYKPAGDVRSIETRLMTVGGANQSARAIQKICAECGRFLGMVTAPIWSQDGEIVAVRLALVYQSVDEIEPPSEE
jgi:hypothetical protein